MVTFFLALLGIVLVCGATSIVISLVDSKVNRTSKLSAAERRELTALRELRDELLMKAIENIEVEPFAVEVLNQIRTTQRSISNP